MKTVTSTSGQQETRFCRAKTARVRVRIELIRASRNVHFHDNINIDEHKRDTSPVYCLPVAFAEYRDAVCLVSAGTFIK